MSEKRDSVEFRGRRKIYTDVDKVTRDNVIYVLRQSLIYHNQNKDDVTRLISFEKGNQPLMREKSVRKDIDITRSQSFGSAISGAIIWLLCRNRINILKAAGRKIMIRPLHCLMRCTMQKIWK